MSEQKKALVLDDANYVREDFLQYGQGQFIVPEIGSPDREGSLVTIENLLRNESFSVILLDGHMGLRLGNKCDGQIIANRLRSGVYGQLNQQIPLLNMSSTYTIDETIKRVSKRDTDSIASVIEKVRAEYLV